MPDARRLARPLRLLALAALGGAACAPADGPRPIVYDREPCAQCRMLISEPRFAAQLETQAGEVLSFDDPGCLLALLARRKPEIRALWFHHLHEDRWLDAEHVAFEPTERTPMGHGLGAVDAGSPGALSLAEAQARVAAAPARPEPRR
jgi:copper chaperone NosL